MHRRYDRSMSVLDSTDRTLRDGLIDVNGVHLNTADIPELPFGSQ